MSREPQVELHRPVAVAQLRPEGEEVLVEASAAECGVLAVRMRVPAVLSLRCRFALRRGAGGSVPASGHLQARVVQACVVTLEAFEAEVEEAFTVRFVPAGTERNDPDPEAEDEIAFSGGVLELGEAAAQQLALALDPYPRKPSAALDLEAEGETETGVGSGAQPSGPFAGLAALKRRR